MNFIRKLLLPKPPVLGRWNSVVHTHHKDKFSDQGNKDYCYTNPKVQGCDTPIIIKFISKIIQQK